jgi:hypothetical protein
VQQEKWQAVQNSCIGCKNRRSFYCCKIAAAGSASGKSAIKMNNKNN